MTLYLRPSFSIDLSLRRLHRAAFLFSRKKPETNLSTLFKPVQVHAYVDSEDVGSELSGKLEKAELLKILNKFTQRREIKSLCNENGLDGTYAPVSYGPSSYFASVTRLPTATGLWLIPKILHRGRKPSSRSAHNL